MILNWSILLVQSCIVHAIIIDIVIKYNINANPMIALAFFKILNIGKLPVDTDVNKVSEDREGSFDERAAEIPPPIPPKMIEDNRSLPESRVVVETQASLPALPPKPVNKTYCVFH